MKFSTILSCDINLQDAGSGPIVLNSQHPNPLISCFVRHIPCNRLVLEDWDGHTGRLSGSIGLWFYHYGILSCRLSIDSESVSVHADYNLYENGPSITLVGELQQFHDQVVMTMGSSDVDNIDFSKIIARLKLNQTSLLHFESPESFLSSIKLIYNPVQEHTLQLSGQIKLHRWKLIESKLLLTDALFDFQNQRKTYGSHAYVENSTLRSVTSNIHLGRNIYVGRLDIDNESEEMVVLIQDLEKAPEKILRQAFGGDEMLNRLRYIDPGIEIVSSNYVGIVITLIRPEMIGVNVIVKTCAIKGQEIILDSSCMISGLAAITGTLYEKSKLVDLLPTPPGVWIRQYAPKDTSITLKPSGSLEILATYPTMMIGGMPVEDFEIVVTDYSFTIAGTLCINNDETILTMDLMNEELDLVDRDKLIITDETWLVGGTVTEDITTIGHLQLMLPNHMRGIFSDSDSIVTKLTVKIDLIKEYLRVTCRINSITIEYIRMTDPELKLIAKSNAEIQQCLDTMVTRTSDWMIINTEAKLLKL